GDRLGRIVEIVLDLVDLRYLRELGDVEGAIGKFDAVRPIESGIERLDLAFATLIGDGIDLVQDAGADEHSPLVALAQRSRVAEPAGIELDLETVRCFQ